jgi:hypothetical protein
MTQRILRGTRHAAVRGPLPLRRTAAVALLIGSLGCGAVIAAGPLSSAGAATSNPIYFYKLVGVLQGLRSKPGQITFAGDGNDFVTGLRWRGWGTSVARAFGTNHVDNCVPNCAQGRISLVRAQVSLSSPGFFRGHHVYLCYRVKPSNGYLSQRRCLP